MGENLLEFKMASKVLIFSAALRRKTEKRYRKSCLFQFNLTNSKQDRVQTGLQSKMGENHSVSNSMPKLCPIPEKKKYIEVRKGKVTHSLGCQSTGSLAGRVSVFCCLESSITGSPIKGLLGKVSIISLRDS